MRSLRDKKFAIVDIETSGTSSNYDRIIEIGILRVENGEIIRTFNTLVNPQRPISPFITEITGINMDELPGAPTFDDISSEIHEMLEGAIFVAHNARFDYGFIKNEFRHLGINFSAACLCTVRLSRRLFSRYKRHDLSSVIERMNLDCVNRHRAYDDAKALYDFMEKIEELGRADELETAVNELIKRSSFPQFLDEKTVSNLPHGSGVYIFYNEAGDVLYVGKSKNLRNRVLSHFSNDLNSTKEMHICQQTKRVEIRETVGELGALLLESELIKKMIPTYNRELRRTSFLVIARKTEVLGYNSVSLERLIEIGSDDYQNVLGVFKSIAQGKKFISSICDEFGLCPKILGVEKSKSSCFSYQLKKCAGACIGKGDIKEFNKIFNRAFARRKLKSWKYDGPIIIEEYNGSERHSFVLDNWCLISEYRSLDSEETPEFKDPTFDYDSYKIFARYLVNSANQKNIKKIKNNDLREIYNFQDNYMPTII